MNKLLKRISIRKAVCGLLVAALALAFAGCSKKVITGDEFKAVAESKGFTVVADDSLAQDKATKTFVARSDNSMICYWEFESDEDAQAAYDTMFEQSQGSEEAAPGAVLEGSNFKKYTIDDIEDYSLISRVDNTLVFGTCGVDQKETFKSVTDELGY